MITLEVFIDTLRTLLLSQSHPEISLGYDACVEKLHFALSMSKSEVKRYLSYVISRNIVKRYTDATTDIVYLSHV